MTDSRNEFDNFDKFDNWHLWKIKILNINQLQGSPMYSKSSSTSFLVKNGRVDGRKNQLFGDFRIVFGLHLSIFGVSDLPILGSNLVKTGVQGVIFDKF